MNSALTPSEAPDIDPIWLCFIAKPVGPLARHEL
jgi:hypothetical protein